MNIDIQATKDMIVADLETKTISVIKAGGPEVEAAIRHVLNEKEYEQIHMFGTDYKTSMEAVAKWDKRSNVHINEWPKPELLSTNGLVVIHDAFNLPNSFGIFLLAQHRGYDILVYGEYGQEYTKFKREWADVGCWAPPLMPVGDSNE